MAGASNPLRNQAEEHIRAELARVGPDRLDRAAIARHFMTLGASKTRIHAWMRAVVAESQSAPPEPDDDDAEAVAAVAEEAADLAATLDALPTPDVLEAIERAAAAPPPEPAPAAPAATAAPAAPAGVSLAPDNAGDALAHLQSVIDTCIRVVTHSHGPDGRVRNPRMALASADMLRKSLETALKIRESINNVRQVEHFMRCVLEELRLLEPEAALAVVERLKAAKGRWA